MSGDVNVLVAPFTDATRPEFGIELSQTIARNLKAARRSVADAALDVQIRGPIGSSAPSNQSTALEAMSEHGAQILVYGEVGSKHGRIVVRPYLYLDPGWLVGVEEFAGAYALDPITAGSTSGGNSTATRLLVRKAVAVELSALASLAVGLSWFDANRMKRALVWLDRAAMRTRGRFAAVAELFRGNVLGKLGRFKEAEDAYLSAELHRQGFHRARLGIVEIHFHRSSSNCGRGAGGKGLRDASAAFAHLARTAATGDDTAANQALFLRARLGQARADFCLSQAGIENRWAKAAAGFRVVFRIGRKQPVRFRTEYAEAHGWLGFTLLPGGPEEPGATAAYQEAQRHFRVARNLTDDSDRRRYFDRMLAFLNHQLSHR